MSPVSPHLWTITSSLELELEPSLLELELLLLGLELELLEMELLLLEELLFLLLEERNWQELLRVPPSWHSAKGPLAQKLRSAYTQYAYPPAEELLLWTVPLEEGSAKGHELLNMPPSWHEA
jgi:hypothetical protein